MIKPLVWQFQLALGMTPLQFNDDSAVAPRSSENYEQRFFWPDDKPIVLQGLTHNELSLSHYEFEARLDCYLLPDARNLKIRKKKLHYKPLLSLNNGIYHYGGKEKFHLEKNQNEISALLGLSSQTTITKGCDFREWLLSQCRHLLVHKESFHLKLGNVALELSRIAVAERFFHSLLVESPHLAHLKKTVAGLAIEAESQDYVTFLQRLL